MKFYIANFAQLRSMNKTCIPISTAVWNPKFFKIGLDSNEVMLGISEKELSPYKVDMSDGCQKDCPNRERVPNCPFLTKYRAYLDTIDFDYLVSEFNRVAEDVRKITHYEGTATIVLLVYESINTKCSERWPLIDWFNANGITLLNFEESALYKKCTKNIR